MEIEVRDKENIWSSSTVVRVHRGRTLKCTVHYDGWDDAWDEEVPWYNNPNLARLYTFTKAYLCIVNMVGDGQKLWPCAVKVRVPDPRCNDDSHEAAEDALRGENNLFIKPYGAHLLPKYMSEGLVNGGRWVHRKCVKMWREISEIPSKDTINNLFDLQELCLGFSNNISKFSHNGIVL